MLGRVLDDLSTMVGTISEERLTKPTPCRDYDVAALRDHIVGWLETFATGLSDDDGRAPAQPSAVTPTTAENAAQMRDAAARIADAVGRGAADRPLHLGESSVPGEMALSMILFEYVVHGWDLATATGESWTPADDAVQAALDFAPGMIPDSARGPDKSFAAVVAVPEDAPLLDRLVGVAGRDPAWSAS